MSYKHFDSEEFDSKDAPGSGVLMDPVFMQMLDSARGMAGIPFVINSGFRTPEHNKKVGGSPTSSHMNGTAADIEYTRMRDAVRIIACLTRAGFTRIGLASNFIHVDCDMSKSHPAYWDYGD